MWKCALDTCQAARILASGCLTFVRGVALAFHMVLSSGAMPAPGGEPRPAVCVGVQMQYCLRGLYSCTVDLPIC